MFSLEGKCALVTGASGGIGAAIALALARQGADVALHYNSNAAAAAQLVLDIREMGRKTVHIQGDLRQAGDCENLWLESEKELGQVDILVNNAGLIKFAFLGLMSEAAWDEVMDVNLKSAFLLSKKAARSMARRKWGRIINISSQAGQTGEVMAAHYSAAKAGMIGLTKSTSRELAPSGITCNAIAPGFVESAMTAGTTEDRRTKQLALVPVGRFGWPEEIAALTVYLASPEAAYVTGQVFAIDGGLRM